MKIFLILILPILTGLQSALWANVSTNSIVLSTLINMFSYLFLAIIFLYIGDPLPKITTDNIAIIIIYLIVLMIVSVLWRITSAFGNAFDPSVASFAEISWPIFTLFFMWFLYGAFSFNRWQIIGGAVSIVGALIVAFNVNSK